MVMSLTFPLNFLSSSSSLSSYVSLPVPLVYMVLHLLRSYEGDTHAGKVKITAVFVVVVVALAYEVSLAIQILLY